jgi:ADP-ribosylation factor-binding protein GGA
MKILSGYDDRNKTDYRAKVAEEVEQLKRKADLFHEMILGVTPEEKIGHDDVFEVSPSSMKSLRHRTWRIRFVERDQIYKNCSVTKPTIRKPWQSYSN